MGDMVSPNNSVGLDSLSLPRYSFSDPILVFVNVKYSSLHRLCLGGRNTFNILAKTITFADIVWVLENFEIIQRSWIRLFQRDSSVLLSDCTLGGITKTFVDTNVLNISRAVNIVAGKPFPSYIVVQLQPLLLTLVNARHTTG